MPESPLLATAEGDEGLILAALTAFIGVGVTVVPSSMMKNKKS